MTEGLEGKRVLVVGASSGIGRCIALEAARSGAEIAVAARRKEQLEKLTSSAGGGTVIVGDVSVAEDCRRIADEAAAALGTIDAVVIAVGSARLRTLGQLSAEEWAFHMNTNVVGVNLTIGAVLPHLAERGVVAVMSTETAGRPFYGLGAYAASKSALEDSMRAWRVERTGTRFVTLVIGTTVGTDFATSFEPDEMREAFPVWAAQGNAPVEHMEPDEVAGVATALLGSLFTRPSIGIETMVLRSPSPLAGTADGMIESVEAAQQQRAVADANE